MSPGRWVVRLGSGLALASLALGLDNLRRVRVPDPSAAPADPGERVAVLLPVRDEETHVLGCLTRLVAAARHWPGPAEVVVLDDGSRDATARLLDDVAASAAASGGRLRVLRGEPTPSGWLGKPWACAQLVDAVPDADVLVLVDADVALTEAAVTASVSLLRGAGLDLVCPYPRQRAEGWAERLVQPLLVWSWMTTLPLRLAERSPRPSLAAANGQLLVVDAGALRRAGGYAAVRGAVLEDLALLRAVKATGGRGGVADGTAVASCRMYEGWPAVRAGWTKSLWSAFGSPAGAVGVGTLLAVVHVAPAAAALRGSRVGLVGYLASVAGRVLVARRTGARAHPDAWAHPLSVLALLGLLADSLVGRRRGTLSWRGGPVALP